MAQKKKIRADQVTFAANIKGQYRDVEIFWNTSEGLNLNQVRKSVKAIQSHLESTEKMISWFPKTVRCNPQVRILQNSTKGFSTQQKVDYCWDSKRYYMAHLADTSNDGIDRC